MAKGMTYARAGVNISKANTFVKQISGLMRTSFRQGVLTNSNAFGGCFSLQNFRYKNLVLVSSTDGVGTKLKIAMLANKHNTVGIDLVAMSVNDVLTLGAEPLFFLDYIALGKIDNTKLVSIVRGIVTGCKQSGCALIGGETAEMPGFYKPDEYDLAGFCVGIVDKEKIITGEKIKPADKLIGIASNGLHSNGFSLVRKVLSNLQIKEMSAQLLKPTRIYVQPVLSLLKKVEVKGIAHITGGAFYDKLLKIFPKNYSVTIQTSAWRVPKIFRYIQKQGNIADKEMFRTFNMGIGMVLVVKDADVFKVQTHLQNYKLKSYVIGEVKEKSNRRIKIV